MQAALGASRAPPAPVSVGVPPFSSPAAAALGQAVDVPDEQLEAEFQLAARRHRDAVPVGGSHTNAAAAKGMPGGGAAASGKDFQYMQQQAVDASSTEVLREGAPSAAAALAGAVAAAPKQAAPGWQELLHPPSLPPMVAELAEDPLAYPPSSSDVEQRGHMQGSTSTAAGSSGHAAARAGGAGKATSAAGNVSLMAGLVHPAVGGASTVSPHREIAGAIGSRLDSVEHMLEEQEAQVHLPCLAAALAHHMLTSHRMPESID